MIWVLLVYMLFGSVFTIAKTGLEYAQPFFFVGTRMVIAGCILIAYQWIVHRDVFRLTASQLWKIVLLATFNIYLTNVFEFWGLKYLTSFKTCFIYSLSPFLAALFSYLIYGEKISLKKCGGLLIGCIGFAPILLRQTSIEEGSGELLFFSWAEVAVMLATVCSVYGWILLQQLVRDEGCSMFKANGLSMVIGGVMALCQSAVMESWTPLPVTEIMPFLECAFLLVIISNLICYNLYGWLLKKHSATFMSFAGFTTPLFTALFGWFFLGEVVSWPFYLSAAIVFLGLLTFYQEELQRDFASTPKVEA